MMKKTKIEDRQLQAKCRGLVDSYFDVFDAIATEIVDETSATINGLTTESIALEYTRREGIKQGIKLFLTKIHSKAAKKLDE